MSLFKLVQAMEYQDRVNAREGQEEEDEDEEEEEEEEEEE
jgi:hypothetical protein